MRKGAQSFHALSEITPLSQHLHLLANLEAFQTASFWSFMKASLHKYVCLNPGPIMIDFNLQFLSWGGERVGLKFQLFNLGWFPWQPAPILRLPRSFPKSCLIDVNSGVVKSCLLSVTKGRHLYLVS